MITAHRDDTAVLKVNDVKELTDMDVKLSRTLFLSYIVYIWHFRKMRKSMKVFIHGSSWKRHLNIKCGILLYFVNLCEISARNYL